MVLFFGKKSGKGKVLENKKSVVPAQSFYSLSTTLNNGQPFSFEALKGKKVLLVNTASNCGYTNQYTELQQLYEHSKEDLVIIAFPSNDFKEQEKGSDADIAQFCQVNYGVSFPLARKSGVLNSGQQNPVFRWLSDPRSNGWNSQLPVWNFSKYLVNESGVLTHYFDPAVSPVSEDVIRAIHNQ